MFDRHISSRLAAYIDGVSGPRESRRIESHLERCERCRRERERIDSGMAALDVVPLLETPESVWTAIEGKLALHQVPAKQGFRAWRTVLAALLIVLTARVAYWALSRPKMAWELVRVRGTPVVDATPVRSMAHVGAGQWIETDSEASATVKLGGIGSVDIAPGTRVFVVAAQRDQDRLSLLRGRIHAKIKAPPKLFLVDTASGTAVDLGCEYSLHTDERGSGLLQVTQGWVSFEWKGLESLVPAGASCRTWPRAGPGAPYFNDASDEFKQAVESFTSAKFKGPSLNIILEQARVRDTLTLWHLLSRTAMPERERIYDRMAALTPVPAGVSREKALQLDPETLTHWKDELAWTW